MKRVSPLEAFRMIQQEGYVYVDVRSEPEFEAGHPAGAFNVPLSHQGPTGDRPNTEFLTVMERLFSKDAMLVIGCRTGTRSLQAVALLAGAGYRNVVDQRAGFDGALIHSLHEPGWRDAGLPVETGAPSDRSYPALRLKKS